MLLICFTLAFLSINAAFESSNNARSSQRTFRSLTMSQTVTNGVIIGGGRIGNLLYELNGKKDILLSDRVASIPDVDGPIYVATRNNDLEAIIEKTPADKRENLVFMQNGILTPYLTKKGLVSNTQCLIYFAVSKKGEKPIDGKTDLNPEGLTAATGKWATDFSLRLNAGDLSCHVLDQETWYIAMLEKHIWICAFMAVGASHGGCTVGEVETKHNEEVRQLINELAIAAEKKTKVKFPAGLGDRLCAYARSVAHFPTALKEFEWRNGWFMDLTFDAVTKMQQDPCPTHTDIMSSQNLFYKAKKDWIERSKKEAASSFQQLMVMQKESSSARELQSSTDASVSDNGEYSTLSPTVRGKRPEIIELAANLVKQKKM